MGFSSKREAEFLKPGKMKASFMKSGFIICSCLRVALNTSEPRLTQVFYQPI
jgi:hypothetical protein